MTVVNEERRKSKLHVFKTQPDGDDAGSNTQLDGMEKQGLQDTAITALADCLALRQWSAKDRRGPTVGFRVFDVEYSVSTVHSKFTPSSQDRTAVSRRLYRVDAGSAEHDLMSMVEVDRAVST